MNKERFNIKQTIYLNRTLDNKIFKLCEKKNQGFNTTVRELLEEALKDKEI